jgi:5'-methylthioadenosine phosphorylase
MSIVGMTTSPEAFLAAEAEIAYACMAHVTDYDVWHDTEEPVTVEMVTKIMSANTELAQQVIKRLVSTRSEWAGTFAAHYGLREALALIGDWGQINEEVKGELKPLIGKYLSD